MYSHLVTVKVGVECHTYQWMKLNCLSLNQDSFKCLHAKTMQGWSTVENDWILGYHILQDIPNFLGALLLHRASTLDGRHVAKKFQFVVNKRLKQFQCHLLRNTALVQP